MKGLKGDKNWGGDNNQGNSHFPMIQKKASQI
jgi:hypothetical protein